MQAEAENMLFQCGGMTPMETVSKISDLNYVRRLSAFVHVITLPLKPLRAPTSLMSFQIQMPSENRKGSNYPLQYRSFKCHLEKASNDF